MAESRKRSARFLAFPGALVLVLLAGCLPPCPITRPVELPEFLLGTSQGGIAEVPISAELGSRFMRGTLACGRVEPVVLSRDLTVAQVDLHPEWIPRYIEEHDWSSSDALLREMKAYELSPVMIIGHGYATTLPMYQGRRVTPDLLGRANYLGHMYLFARAAVERYDGDGRYDAPGGLTVKLWQLENELNQAFYTAVWGWREPSFTEARGSAWQDWSFLTSLLSTLSRAVKKQDPSALTMTNFHTDVPEGFNHMLLLPSWPESIRLWIELIDVVGIDAYPNYYDPDPPMGWAVGERVRTAMDMACGKPVVVVETGYPTGPPERGYTEQGQALYIQEAYDTSVAAGAQGFFLFGAKTAERHTVEITEEDLATLEDLAGLFEEERYAELLLFVARNQDYVAGHFSEVVQSVEPYWGLVRLDGTHKPGFDVFQAIAQGL